jgi:hypothetical protein
MRRIEYSRRHEEPSCGVRDELLNRGSGVRVPAPAPLFVFNFGPQPVRQSPRYSRDIANRLVPAWPYEPDPNSGAAVFRTAVDHRRWYFLQISASDALVASGSSTHGPGP